MYNKTIWKDRVVDPDTGAVIQEGTFMSAEHFNNMENGIAAVDSAIADISGGYEDIEEALETGVGTTVSLTLNQSTFVLNLALKNSKGTKISEQSVDLPIESMIVNAEYVASTKSLVLTLQSGSTVTVPLSGLISGLVNDTRKVAGIDLKDDITVSELKTALDVDDLEQNKVNKTTTVNGKALSSNITLAGSDLKLNATSYTKDSTSKTISKDTKVDEAVAQIEYRVDKKVDKATASTSQYTKSTVTVPACLGYAGIKMVGGKTQKINQFANASWARSSSTLTVSVSNGTITLNGTTSDSETIQLTPTGGYEMNVSVTSGEKWYIKGGSANIGVCFNSWGNWSSSPTSEGSDTIATATETYSTFIKLYSNASGISVSNVKLTPQFINLTKIFGSGNEPTIEQCRVLFADYVPYTEGTLWNGAVEKIVSKDTNGNIKTTISVPNSILSLPDYGCSVGDVYNWVDFENGVYHHNVGSVDLGSLEWIYYNDSNHENFVSKSVISNSKTPTSGWSTVNTISKYNSTSSNDVYMHTEDDSLGITTENKITIYDSSYTSEDSLKNSLNGQKLYYELADSAKETIPLSTFIPPISCEEGGTITLQNPHSLDVPNKIVYKKEVI